MIDDIQVKAEEPPTIQEPVADETETNMTKLQVELDQDNDGSKLGVDSEEEGEVKSIKSQSPPPPESPKKVIEQTVQEPVTTTTTNTTTTATVEKPQTPIEEALEDGEIAE